MEEQKGRKEVEAVGGVARVNLRTDNTSDF